MDLILIGMVIGFVISIFLGLLGFGLIIIYCFIRRQNKLEHPYIVSISASFIIGILYIIICMKDAGGEEGLVAMGLAPFILSGFIFGGVIIGKLLSYLNRLIGPSLKKHYILTRDCPNCNEPVNENASVCMSCGESYKLIAVDIYQKIEKDFGNKSRVVYEDFCDLYSKTKGPISDRLIRAIIYLAGGNIEKMRMYIEMALIDWRDVIWQAEYDSPKDPIRKRNFKKTFLELGLIK